MKKTLQVMIALTVLHVSFSNPAAQAQEVCEKNTVHVKVNGLVCDFCARALEKVFGRREEVKGIQVDLNNGDVTVEMHSGKSMDENVLKKLIRDSGYDIRSIEKAC